MSVFGASFVSPALGPCRARLIDLGLMQSWTVLAHVLMIFSLSPTASEIRFPLI